MTRTTWTRIAALPGLWALVAAAGGCSVNPATGQRELILIPESQEIAMGLEAAPKFEKEFGGKVPNETLQAYVAQVGGRIAAVADRKMEYQYTLVASKVPNAFALPGGQIFVTAGLIRLMSSERELAAVLGHETGHVCAKHNVKGMQRQIGASVLADLAAQIAGGGDTAAAAAKVAGTMITMKYSRDDEFQADELGTKYMSKAGYNPWGMVELLTVLLNLHEKEPSKLEELFQTHPISSKRIADATAMIQQDHAAARKTDPDPKAGEFLAMRKLLIDTVGAGR